MDSHARDLHSASADGQGLGVKIDVRPAQPEHLATAEAEDGELPGRAQSVVRDSLPMDRASSSTAATSDSDP
jgi:hypothetical protein